MAACHEVKVTISSARDLKNVNWRHGPIRPYAVVWVDPEKKCSSRVDEEGDTFPHWDETLKIRLPGPVDSDTILYIDIVHAGGEEDTKPLIGSTGLYLHEVIDEVGLGERAKRTLQLTRPSGRPHGQMDVKIKIKETRYRPAADPYYAPQYAVPPQAAASRDYPAAAYAAPYGAAPAPAPNPYYQAPPAEYQYGGYNYNAPPYGQPAYDEGSGHNSYGKEEKKKSKSKSKSKSKFGGMGAGLAMGAVAGALGGLALAEGVDALEDRIDDAAEGSD